MQWRRRRGERVHWRASGAGGESGEGGWERKCGTSGAARAVPAWPRRIAQRRDHETAKHTVKPPSGGFVPFRRSPTAACAFLPSGQTPHTQDPEGMREGRAGITSHLSFFTTTTDGGPLPYDAVRQAYDPWVKPPIRRDVPDRGARSDPSRSAHCQRASGAGRATASHPYGSETLRRASLCGRPSP